MKPKYFEFGSYTADWQSGELTFTYKVELEDGTVHVFNERLTIDRPVLLDRAQHPAVTNTLEMLHLLLGVSYFKAYGPAEIRHPYAHTQAQAAYWNTMYTQGMGEYYYTNNLDFENRVSFPIDDVSENKERGVPLELSARALILHGGGKDSIVSVEIAKKAGVHFDLFAVHVSEIQEEVARVMQKKVMSINRRIDPHLIELNKTGDVYNGHVPIAAIYSACAVLYALLFDYQTVIVSNEHSASYGNVDYKGMVVNHQWDKSEEYEHMLRDYLATSITPSITYFSLLRPLFEIKIAEIFSRYPEYFEAFSSSNHNFILDQSGEKKRWSVAYSKGKVEFVWALLSAFLPRSEMLRIFQEDIYAREDVLDTFKELLGLKDIKPLECVGTPEETKVAMYMASQRGEFKGTPVMDYFEKEVIPTLMDSIDALKEEVFAYGDDSNIPENFRGALSAIMKTL